MSSEITPAQKTALLKLEGFKAIRDQYAKEQKMAGSGKKRMKGRGFWDDVYNWFKGAGQTVNEFLKKTKLISNVAGAVLPILAPLGTALLTANPIAAAASVGAAKAAAQGISSLGYGAKEDARAIARAITGRGKIKGGELSNKLVINPTGQRLMGKGQTFGFTGQAQQTTAPAHSGIMRNMRGSGLPAQSYKLKTGNIHGTRKSMIGTGGIPYGSISSEFGNIKT
jgi:hypothetical protein